MSQKILQGKTDLYRGITIRTQNNPVSPAEAPELLKRSLDQWTAENVHGVWFNVQSQDAFWVTLLIENGFEFHHAQPGYVMLTKWLPTSKPATLPRYPFTSIGVGGVVMNSKEQFLLVKEKRGIYLGWKFPGGLADPNEEIFQTAQREIFEETGVDTEFESIFTMRHTTSISSYKNVGDMYFVCAMKPRDENNIEPKRCPREISACQWMTLEEITSLPSSEFHKFNKSILDVYLHWKRSGRKGFYQERFEIPEFKRSWSVYNVD